MFWIRAAEAEDYSSVCDLLSLCGLPADDLTPAHLRDFIVADHDGKIRGVVGFERFGEHALLRSLTVSPDFRCQGVAGQLLDEIEELAKQKGVRHLYGLTLTAEDVLIHRSFSRIDRSLVPSAIADSPQFASICPLEAVCLQKPLT